MVHNGIEYGVMAAYAEGLNIPSRQHREAAQQTVDAETAPLSSPENTAPISTSPIPQRHGDAAASLAPGPDPPISLLQDA